MRVAVTVTKVFDTDARDLAELQRRMEELDEDDEDFISWYDLEPLAEIWSYGVVENYSTPPVLGK